MAHRVTYQDKSGKTLTSTFTGDKSELLAKSFARTVRNPKIDQVEVDAPAPTVTQCPEATAEIVAASAKEQYLQDRYGIPSKKQREQRAAEKAARAAEDREHEAERASEFFAGARCAGVSQEVAIQDYFG